MIDYCLDLSVLLDLKHLLIEAKQEVPVFLRNLESETEKHLNIGTAAEDKGCAYCSGLGHRIADCPKLESMQNKVCYLSTFIFEYESIVGCTNGYSKRFSVKRWRLVIVRLSGARIKSV
jgi:hypothetical protein